MQFTRQQVEQAIYDLDRRTLYLDGETATTRDAVIMASLLERIEEVSDNTTVVYEDTWEAGRQRLMAIRKERG